MRADGAARPGEDREVLAVPRLRPASCSSRSSPTGADPATCGPPPRRSQPVEPWEAARIEEALRALAERLGQKPREAFGPIRLAVTGSKVSPGLFESLELLGKEESLARLALRLGARAGAGLSGPVKGPRQPERVEQELEAPPGSQPELQRRHRQRIVAAGRAPPQPGSRMQWAISLDERASGAAGYGVRGGSRRTDARNASRPPAQIGQGPIVAPTANVAAPATASTDARSGVASAGRSSTTGRAGLRGATSRWRRAAPGRGRRAIRAPSRRRRRLPRTRRVDDLARCVACAAERRRELLVGALGPGRRSQPERVLRRDVQPVLMAAKLVERCRRRAGRGSRRAPRAGRASARRCTRGHPPGSRTAPGLAPPASRHAS